MSRIGWAFETRFRALFGGFGARDREKGVRWAFGKGEELKRREDLSLSQGLARVNVALARKLHRFIVGRRGGERKTPEELRIICDAGLGGLARWLRAMGCETIWIPDIQDSDLLEQAREQNAIVITTDSPLLNRRLITHGVVKAIWVPPTLKVQEQLEVVVAELGIEPEPSRCMQCGGNLRKVEKEDVRERIPPRTYKWVEEYFECEECGKLYWHGTHWQKIQTRLRGING